MRDPIGYVCSDIDAKSFEFAFRQMKRRDRNDRICRTVHQQYSRLLDVITVDPGRFGEHARVADDGSHCSRSAQSNMKRHHRALAEANQRQIRFGQSILRQLAINK